MVCTRCGGEVNLAPGVPAKCAYCGHVAEAPPADPRVAALMTDANHNGIPDVIERMAGAGAGAGGFALAGSSYRSAPVADLAFVPPAPRQPSAQAREIVYRYQGGQKVILIIGLVFTLMGTVFGFVFLWGLPVDIAIGLSGKAATGTVVSTETQANVKVNNRHPTLIHFRYKVDGAWHEGSSSALSPAILRSAAPGASVPVEYVPAAPDWVRVAGTTYSTFGYSPVFVLIFPFVGLMLLLRAIGSNRREIRAFERGTPIVATVTYQGPDHSTRMNGQHPFLIRWSFVVGTRTFTGSMSHMSPQALRPLVRGTDQIVVLYDPANPAVNTVHVA